MQIGDGDGESATSTSTDRAYLWSHDLLHRTSFFTNRDGIPSSGTLIGEPITSSRFQDAFVVGDPEHLMNQRYAVLSCLCALALGGCLAPASESEDESSGGSGGSAGSGGQVNGGTGGSAGESGTGGTSASGSGGSSSGGTSGSGGATGGASGAGGSGGTAGTAGAAGSAGEAGSAGSAGTAGASGTGGTAGTGGTGGGGPVEYYDAVDYQEVDFGNNPGNLNMYIHVHDNMPKGTGKPLVLALHGCDPFGITPAKSFKNESGWSTLADDRGFYVVYPEQQTENQSAETGNPYRCFNWAGYYGEHRDRGEGENASIIAMIDYMKATYSIDDSRIFITGLSARGWLGR